MTTEEIGDDITLPFEVWGSFQYTHHGVDSNTFHAHSVQTCVRERPFYLRFFISFSQNQESLCQVATHS